MKLCDFLEEIALSELNSTNVVALTEPVINTLHLPKVIASLNTALTHFYTKFPLKKSQVIIELHQNISRYYLDSDYAYSNDSSPSIRYLLDSKNNPFEDDLIQILEIFDEHGNSLSIDNNLSVRGVFKPEFNCVELGRETHSFTNYLNVVYKCKHKKIPLNSPIDSRININIPSSLEEALKAYTANLVLIHMGGMEYINAANLLYARYTSLLKDLDTTGIIETVSLSTNTKPMQGGWI